MPVACVSRIRAEYIALGRVHMWYVLAQSLRCPRNLFGEEGLRLLCLHLSTTQRCQHLSTTQRHQDTFNYSSLARAQMVAWFWVEMSCFVRCAVYFDPLG